MAQYRAESSGAKKLPEFKGDRPSGQAQFLEFWAHAPTAPAQVAIATTATLQKCLRKLMTHLQV